jgi:hypothetical protein
VICAFEVEEIAVVAETRLPPWAREVFPSVRAHMPWMDTPAGPIELLIGLDNSQWLPMFLEDSKEPAVNMRLMKSSFGHPYMVMGSRGTALYPRDESMRYRGDPTGGRLTHAEMEQKVRLERCFGEIPTGTQERGEDTHKRTRTRTGRSGSRLRARGEQEAPTRQDSCAATSTAQRGSTATDQDAFQPPASTPPPPAKPGRARARGERAWGSCWSTAATGADVSSAHGGARLTAAAGARGSGAEIGPHDGADGAGNATSI